MDICTNGLILCYCYRLYKGRKTSLEIKKKLVVLELLIQIKKNYSCKLVRAWCGIISVSFHTHAAKTHLSSFTDNSSC